MIHALPGWLLFVIATAGVLGAAWRGATRCSVAGSVRIVATAALAAAVAVADVLVLGLVGLGGNGLAVAGLAALELVAVRFLLRPAGPAPVEQLVAWWRSLTLGERGWLGAALGVAAVWTAHLVSNPLIGTDGLVYHLAEPVIWLHDGRPGSLHTVVAGLPQEAYPKTGEVLVEWSVATARTPISAALLMMATLGIAAVSLVVILRRLGVGRRMTGALTATLALNPIVIQQISGPNTDLLSLTWALAAAALCLSALEDSRSLPVAVVAAGVAIGIKTTVLPAVLILLGVTAWRLRHSWRGLRWALGLSLVTAIGTGGIWYVVDLARYGAPLYPFSAFPAGPPVPRYITVLGASFLHAPRLALRVGTVASYVRLLGGALALGVGTAVAFLLLPTVRDRRLRRRLATVVVAATAETVLWSAAPFTGWSGIPGTEGFIVGGLRYLLPGMALVTVAVGVLSTSPGVGRLVAALFVAAALGLDVRSLNLYNSAYRPGWQVIVAAALIGAVTTGWLSLGSPRRARLSLGSLWTARLSLTGAAVAFVVVLSAAVPGYLGRHIATARVGKVDNAAVLSFLSRQPGWTTGNAEVVSGPTADAMYAGATFRHPISVLNVGTACSTVRRDQVHDWVILATVSATAPLAVGQAYDLTSCLAGVRPAFRSGNYTVFRPQTG